METKLIYFYAMHRYDLIFYARLAEELNSSNKPFDYRLIVTPNIYNIPHVKEFICEVFPAHTVVPIADRKGRGIIRKVIDVFTLRAWVRSKLKHESTVVLCDKSQPLSRCFLKHSHSSVLVQQVEAIDHHYRLDLVNTLWDAVRCIFLKASFALWYVNKSSGGKIKALKLISKPKSSVTVFHAYDRTLPKSFTLPPLNTTAGGKKIVIFGSRFLSWPFFNDGKRAQRIERLTSIYRLIKSHFPLHEIVYIPHPLEAAIEFDLINRIFAGRLKRDEAYFSSEHYLYRNRDISHTFSIGSTSSFSAFNMGVPCKVFYRMLDFPASVDASFDRIFSGLPGSFFAVEEVDLLNPCTRPCHALEADYLSAFQKALSIVNDLSREKIRGSGHG